MLVLKTKIYKELVVRQYLTAAIFFTLCKTHALLFYTALIFMKCVSNRFWKSNLAQNSKMRVHKQPIKHVYWNLLCSEEIVNRNIGAVSGHACIEDETSRAFHSFFTVLWFSNLTQVCRFGFLASLGKVNGSQGNKARVTMPWSLHL